MKFKCSDYFLYSLNTLKKVTRLLFLSFSDYTTFPCQEHSLGHCLGKVAELPPYSVFYPAPVKVHEYTLVYLLPVYNVAVIKTLFGTSLLESDMLLLKGFVLNFSKHCQKVLLYFLIITFKSVVRSYKNPRRGTNLEQTCHILNQWPTFMGSLLLMV